MQAHIYPVFDQLIQPIEKERFLNQKGITLWFTGLSGSGKTTVAKQLERALFNQGYLVQMLDGDNIRSGINNNLGFSPEDRVENIRRIAEVSKLFNDCGIITINCFVSPTQELRDLAKQIITPSKYFEVFISTPLAVCEARDVKGLYAKARRGEILDFTGVNAPFEPPQQPFLNVNTEVLSVADSTALILSKVLPHIQL